MNGALSLLTLYAYPLATVDGHPWGHGGGWMWIFGPVMFLLWIGFIAVVVWLLARTFGPRNRSGVHRAREILAERYASGELSTEEYRERLDQLR